MRCGAVQHRKTLRTESSATAETFEAMAMPLFDSLYNFAHWLAQNREDAEDLVQETYAKALKGFSSFQPGTNFRAWMFRILRNTFLTSRTGLRASSVSNLDPEDEDRLPSPSADSPEMLAIGAAAEATVHRAIEAMPVHFREVLLLADVEEMSYQEIADTLSIPIGTVMSRLSRARKAIRDELVAGGFAAAGIHAARKS